jgi:hypothetical protein
MGLWVIQVCMDKKGWELNSYPFVFNLMNITYSFVEDFSYP